jgi:hypothetical protein
MIILRRGAPHIGFCAPVGGAQPGWRAPDKIMLPVDEPVMFFPRLISRDGH